VSSDLAVIVCTNKGPEGVDTTLAALGRQSARDRLEVVVVDDGSPDSLVDTCARHGVHLVCHEANRGLAAARNTGIAATSAPLIAFTDDDCIPDPPWTEQLLQAFEDPRVIAAGGPVRPFRKDGYLERYYAASNPLAPLEIELSKSAAIPYRLWLYVKTNVAPTQRSGARDVYSLVGANFSFRRCALEAVGGFDPGIRFGGEDEDVFFRLRRAVPQGRLRFEPAASMAHDYNPSLRDALRRARAYGAGNARNCAKHPEWRPTLYPAPVLLSLVTAAALWQSRVALLIPLLPLLMSPRWLVFAARHRSPLACGYCYVQLLQEAASNIGFASAWPGVRR
jgi:GT2 family glycosyltransferase